MNASKSLHGHKFKNKVNKVSFDFKENLCQISFKKTNIKLTFFTKLYKINLPGLRKT
jgi:hypothetical protein